MRVKRLEVQGFKSFKDKTIIHFDKSITGIVGPNGCGKSNIVDAFFWVMGEQSYKHMRGSGSGDLIFNGSSKYAPLGYAEATLVLETDAADTENAPSGASVEDIPLKLRVKEIAVTRRVYRTGEGEYFINGVQVRLRDIHELFMDTGVGAKGYSVIEQGQIGRIVNAKPEERRRLVEEAAGIAKYKARKKETYRKLDSTQGNLSRLNDVIQEIERNLSSLERQAAKARKYKEYKKDLFEKETTWGRRKIALIRKKINETEKDRQSYDQELTGIRAELQVTENDLETNRVKQLSRSKEAEELQSKVQSLSDTLTQEKSSLELSRSRCEDLEKRLRSLEAEKQELRTGIEREESELTEKENRLTSLESQLQESESKVQEKEQELGSVREDALSTRQGLEQAQRDLMECVSRGSELNSRSAAMVARIESVESQLEGVKTQETVLREKASAAETELNECQTKARELIEQTDAKKTAKEQATDELKNARIEVERHAKTIEEKRDVITQKNSRLQSLKELDQAYEGMQDGPKSLLEWQKDRTDKHIQVLADVYQVSKGFESVLENWLEEKLEFFVSDNSVSAKEALDFLKQDGKGRVSIFLSDMIKSEIDNLAYQPSTLDEAPELMEFLRQNNISVLGAMSDFIKINEDGISAVEKDTVRRIARELVENVIVVESLSDCIMSMLSAGQSIQEVLNGWAIVGKDGLILESNGVLRGGVHAAEDSVSLFGRKQMILELESEISTLKQELSTFETEIEAAKGQVTEKEVELSRIENELKKLEIDSAALDRDIHQANSRKDDLEKQLSSHLEQVSNLENQVADARKTKADSEFELAELVSKRSELEEKVKSNDAVIEEKELALRTQENELQELKIEAASMRERVQGLRREIESTRNYIADRNRRANEIDETLKQVEEDKNRYQGQDTTILDKIEDLTKTHASHQESLSEAKNELEILAQSITEAMDRIKDYRQKTETHSGKMNTFAIEIERLNGELNHLIQNLEEKYGSDILNDTSLVQSQEEMEDPVVTQEMSEEEEKALGEEVEKLREKIRRLGEVNTMAVEEFEEISKRHEYLTRERSDLEESIKNLEDAIEHINMASVERFKETFAAISNRFERLFPIIFGGGRAQLSLVYPEGSDDILDAGIDILAQPPGKKIVNMGLLSGGEKALTAVSLIFAIFMVKPSPFCVLDEVDAPLDDANIGKFNALLKEMSSKTQFILITHNKKTMELNDTLYGVTMEEPGVSKMVSIEMS